MNGIDKISFELNGNLPIAIITLLVLTAYTYYTYRFTIPKLNSPAKFLLIFLRTLSIFLILFFLLEPVVTVQIKKNTEPHTLFFIDNSNSIAVQDSAQKIEKIKSFFDRFKGTNRSFFAFDNKVNPINESGISEVLLNGYQTNFEAIIQKLKKSNTPISSTVILSDGIITEGNDPVNDAEKLQFPIYTVGIGDTAIKRDAQISAINHNDLIFTDKETEIELNIRNNFLEGKKSTAFLYEGSKLIGRQEFVFSQSGINKVKMNYTPARSGEIKLRALITQIKDEFSAANNSFTKIVKVRDSKIKVCILAGAPSPDLSAVTNILESQKELKVSKIVQVADQKFLDNLILSKADSSDIFIMVNFPSATTPQNLLDKIAININQRNKPFFILVTSQTDFNKLSQLQNNLPFTWKQNSKQLLEIQTQMAPAAANYLTSAITSIDKTSQLPLINRVDYQIIPKPYSEVIASSSSIKNLAVNPLIITSRIGNKKSFVIIGEDIWRWQLQSAVKVPDYLAMMINDVTRWLGYDIENDQLEIQTNKQVYSPGEEIEITAQLFNQSFIPVNDATAEANLKFNGQNINIPLTSISNGLYQSVYSASEIGDYELTGSASYDGVKVKSKKKVFVVENLSIERTETRMNEKLLQLLANSNSGRYYSIDNLLDLQERIEENENKTPKFELLRFDFNLWASFYSLILLVFLLSLEWFLRKKHGLL